MVRIAPVRLDFNPKTLWFDAGDLELSVGDEVVVTTARGSEFGRVSDVLFEMEYADTKKLKSPLKPVQRKADDDDRRRAAESAELSMAALPVFRQVAKELAPDMNPVAVEYLFDGSKAVFYFDSEARVDFRDLVRKLAADLHVRVDMKQIGVRDGARMVGGLGHCGQELCCRRLGGEFNPVSIRMAKEQDLSLNPQKISGICGRLMCCLRYEFETYKDFHGRAPKKNARVETPDGEGKVVDLDVPREVVSIKVGDEKPVKVPLADMEPPAEGKRPNAVGEEAWEKANEPATFNDAGALNLFSNELTGEDKLAEPGSVRHVHGDEGNSKSSRSRRRRGGRSGASGDSRPKEGQAGQRKSRRRRSTTVSSDGSTQVEKRPQDGGRSGGHDQELKQKQSSGTRRRRSRSGAAKQQAQSRQPAEGQLSGSKVGRNSSALRSGRPAQEQPAGSDAPAQKKGSGQRRRRRSHKSGAGQGGQGGQSGQGKQQ